MTNEEIAALPVLSKEEFLSLDEPRMAYLIAFDAWLVRDRAGVVAWAPDYPGSHLDLQEAFITAESRVKGRAEELLPLD